MIRRALLLAGTLVLIPQAALADEAHQAASGVNLPLVVIGGLVLAAGIGLRLAGRLGPWAAGLAALGLVVGALGFVLPRLGGEEISDARVSIVKPEAGDEVPAGKPVTVRVALRGGTIATSPTDEDGGHLHLYVDGKLQQMPYSKTVKVELEPGRHELRVEYVDHQHLSFDPEIDTTVEVRAT